MLIGEHTQKICSVEIYLVSLLCQNFFFFSSGNDVKKEVNVTSVAGGTTITPNYHLGLKLFMQGGLSKVHLKTRYCTVV